MTRRRNLSLAMLIVAAVLACGQATRLPAATSTLDAIPPQPSTTGSDPKPTATLAKPQPTAAIPFVVAIEYAVPGLAEVYAQTGVTYAKPQPIWGLWATIEPEQGQFDWKPLDALVLEYQKAGYTGIQILLSCESPWAATRPPALGDKGDPFPKEEYLDEYAAFVRKVVERYDADGLDDMPDLLYPVHHYGVEREFTGYWPTGDAGQYVRLLRIAYPEIRAADHEAEVLLVALLLGDIFHDNPPLDEVEQRLNQKTILSFSVGKVRTLLAACDAYDIVDFHSLADYVEIPPTAAWIRSELEANGCGEKPIWIGDAFSMSGLIGYSDPWGLVPMKAFAPATEATADAVLALLQEVADAEADDHEEATAWLRAEMARGLVRKIVVAAGEGLAGINIGNMEDWTFPYGSGFNAALARSMGTSLFMGMVDRKVTNRTAGGPLHATGGDQMSKIRDAEELRPAFYALEMVVSRIGGFSAVERLEMDEGVWAYRFETPQGPTWVLWYDDRKLHLPGEPVSEVATTLPLEAPRAQLTWTPTTQGQREPQTEVVETTGGSLRLTLGATPVFVRSVD
jgi:hypothetical protein